jgi:hypothetical protein
MLTAMKTALPCPECSAHYNAWLSAHSLSLPHSGPELTAAISSWVLALHNDVNARNGKGSWTLDQVMAAYQDKAAARTALATLRSYMSASFLSFFGPLL